MILKNYGNSERKEKILVLAYLQLFMFVV